MISRSREVPVSEAKVEITVALCIIAIADIALILSKFPSAGSAVALCLLVAFVPVIILITFRWTGRITEEHALREGRLSVYSLITALAAPASQKAFTAVILGVASVYFLLAGRLAWRRYKPSLQWSIAVLGGCSLAGILADQPTYLGWHTLTFACYGLSTFLFLCAGVNASYDTPEE